jgi:hypothetical protein
MQRGARLVQGARVEVIPLRRGTWTSSCGGLVQGARVEVIPLRRGTWTSSLGGSGLDVRPPSLTLRESDRYPTETSGGWAVKREGIGPVPPAYPPFRIRAGEWALKREVACDLSEGEKGRGVPQGEPPRCEFLCKHCWIYRGR